MEFKELVRANRSCRRFHQEHKIEQGTLRELVDLARLSASGSNKQPLKFNLSSEMERNTRIFPLLGWAAYLKDWPGPPEGERPSAYIVILGDKNISQTFGVDPGIAAQSILLGATEKGLAGCIIATINKDKLSKALEIPEQYEILYVLALGKPKERIQIDDVGLDGNIRYWRDEQGVHHVPKRSLDELIIG
jgi:nitroreductase